MLKLKADYPNIRASHLTAIAVEQLTFHLL